MRGVYIHIPFCIRKCHYCDFYSVSDYSLQEAYFKALKNEIKDFSDKNARLQVDTVFFGGGTPSSVCGKYIAEILNLLREYFFLSENAEITLEANPKTFDEEKLLLYKESGINRLSMGLQSADCKSLKTIGRIHSLNEFESSYYLARKVGFSNINIDIMYGLPGETKEILADTLKTVIAFNPEHISAYALTLSENVPMYKMGLSYPDEDEVYKSYMMICDMLSSYRHYEISNFGKIPCQHNMLYWSRDEYIGFGAAASGFIGNKRYTNKSDINSYIKDFSQKESIEILDKNDAVFEYIMLGLRTDMGIDADMIYEKNKDFIDLMEKEGYLNNSGKRIILTDKGFFVSNRIISSLVI